MKKGIVFLITIILVFSLVIIGISKTNNQSQSEEKIKIIATLFPQYDFAKQIGGDKVEVSLLLTPGTETHTYEPTPQDIINVNKADLYIYTGKYMEPWSDKIANIVFLYQGSRLAFFKKSPIAQSAYSTICVSFSLVFGLKKSGMIYGGVHSHW